MHNMGTRLPNQQHLSHRHTPILSKGQVVQWEYFMLFRVKVNSFEKFNLTLKYIIFSCCSYCTHLARRYFLNKTFSNANTICT